MLSGLAAVLFLVAIGAVGVAGLRRAALGLTTVEQVAFGIPLGGVVATLALIPLAIAFGLTRAVVVGLGVMGVAGAAVLWPERPKLPSRWVRGRGISDEVIGELLLKRVRLLLDGWRERAVRDWGATLATLVLVALAVRWIFYFDSAMTTPGGTLWAGHEFIWSDWSAHIGDVTAFAYGDNFPPENPRVLDKPYAYHFLPSLTSAALVTLGISPWGALALGSCFYSLAIGLGLYAFARRLIGHHGSAVLATVLFLFGGSVGWILTVSDIEQSHDLWGTLFDGNPWNYGRLVEEKFNANIPYIFRLASERGYTYGLPLAMLVLTLLLIGVRSGRQRAFVGAGVVAGLMPLAHLSSLLALGLITPFLFLLFPRRGWFLAGPVAAALAAPQLLWLLGGEGGAANSFREQLGWIAAPDQWWWFWVKNLGFFIPLLALAVVDRGSMAPPSRRFLWAFLPIFALANVFVFQPWDGDNTKVLMYWFLGVCVLVAGLLGRAWREHGTPATKVMIGGVVLTMILTGLLGSLDQYLGKDEFQLLSAEEMAFAERVRAETPEHALFVIGLQANHPVSMLTGRPVVLSFPGWAWAYGIPAWDLEEKVRRIYRFEPETPDLLRELGASYLVIGPFERREMSVNEEMFRALYPVVIEMGSFVVLDVRG